ncbi:MAG: DEAD/DEAH box helicase [Planctomycetes bacterium]|nr:DEAD/DEAH box helicase [Planctomycetota bacterium]
MLSSPPPDEAAPAAPFDAVPAPLRAALTRRGFATLTAVQTAVLQSMNEAQSVRDLQITSQTGSGKTVALGFALAPALLEDAPDRAGPTTLVIAPTRELAAQIRDELQWLFADVRHVGTDCVTGGTSQQLERQRLRKRPTIVVGTPGRLLDHVTNGALILDSVSQLVLDEADQMLDMGFRDELEAILAKVPADRRTHLVSATFPPAVRNLTKRYQRDALHIEGTALGQANVDIEHVAHLLNARDRYGALVNHLLLAGDVRVLVFVRTREDTTSLADKLETDGFRAMPLSGDLTQAQRTRTLAAFRRGTITTLVATDVAARGLDVPDVQSVVHMDPPIDGAAYTHRSGRTGRAGQKGKSVLLVSRSLERGARRLISEARVPMQWRPVPTAAEVQAARDEQTMVKLTAALDGQVPATAQQKLAQRLLADRDPVAVVATLLGELGGGPVVEPFAVHSVAPHGSTGPGRVHAPPAPHGPGAPQHGDGPPRREEGFVTFRINWGVADGADPRRILAHVCRRGGVDSKQVGAIDLRRFESTFGIAAEVAGAFTQRVRRRDPRDPHLAIHPYEGRNGKPAKRPPFRPAFQPAHKQPSKAGPRRGKPKHRD